MWYLVPAVYRLKEEVEEAKGGGVGGRGGEQEKKNQIKNQEDMMMYEKQHFLSRCLVSKLCLKYKSNQKPVTCRYRLLTHFAQSCHIYE